MHKSSLVPLNKSVTSTPKSLSEQTFSSLPPLNQNPPLKTSKLPSFKNTPEENLMKVANKVPDVEKKNVEKEFVERSKALPINTSLSKVKPSESTAQFSDRDGALKNQDIEKALLERGFISTEKILTKDADGNVVCRFIKARDNLGHALYIELDTTCAENMGYVSISSADLENVMTVSTDASVIPYSLKVGSFEASSSSLFGVGFECDNQVCVMSRKDKSLTPTETVFTFTRNEHGQDMGVQEKHPIPFPIVKLSEILANPQAVMQNIASSHARMRNIAFNSCMKDVIRMKKNLGELQREIERFDHLTSEKSSELSSTISQLEEMHKAYMVHGAKTAEDGEKLKSIKFNLQKRGDLAADYIALCHSMRERGQKIAVLNEEIKSLNDFAETLFDGLNNVFVE